MSDDPLDQLDYYELLRVAETASGDDIRRAFHDFAMRYHPDRYADADDEKRERAAAIYRRGAEGYRVLSDAAQRRVYDEGLAKGRVRYEEPRSSPGGAGPPSGVIDVKALRARPFVQKALEQIKSGDLKGAKLNLTLALNYEPDNAALNAKLDEIKQKLAAK